MFAKGETFLEIEGPQNFKIKIPLNKGGKLKGDGTRIDMGDDAYEMVVPPNSSNRKMFMQYILGEYECPVCHTVSVPKAEKEGETIRVSPIRCAKCGGTIDWNKCWRENRNCSKNLSSSEQREDVYGLDV